MYSFLSFLGGVGVIAAIVLTVLYFKRRKKQPEKARKYALYAWICVAVFMIFGWLASITPEGKQEAHDEDVSSSIEESRDAKSSSVKKEKAHKASVAKAESSSADKAMKKQEKAQREKSGKLHYKQLQNYLSNLPTKYEGAIDDAYYSPQDSKTIIVMNEAVLDVSAAKLKAVVRGAWNLGQNAYNKYSPLPDNVNANYVTVQDSAGNELAHTSLLGNFDYDADK
ncbi:hypothetical protein [Lentilactobacillus parabuchneri]|uniref:hypothetical protein n=1 Tax=Lentilactobacillus parabuchneri TaxID=152331 RepID=UPI00178CDEB2|nr:hypothetical protein [Lentilactobacillus parabuchneri]QOJ85184.1 hypothetical protein ILQ00_00590 [Lentilactobacillus parabuchneri]